MSLNKAGEYWWSAVLEGEEPIDIDQINKERSMATVDEEEHAVLDRLTFDYHQKLQGKPQSHELVCLGLQCRGDLWGSGQGGGGVRCRWRTSLQGRTTSWVLTWAAPAWSAGHSRERAVVSHLDREGPVHTIPVARRGFPTHRGSAPGPAQVGPRGPVSGKSFRVAVDRQRPEKSVWPEGGCGVSRRLVTGEEVHV